MRQERKVKKTGEKGKRGESSGLIKIIFINTRYNAKMMNGLINSSIKRQSYAGILLTVPKTKISIGSLRTWSISL